MRTRISLALFVLISLLSLCAQAQVGFSPQYYDLSLDEAQKTHAFRLFNMTKEDKQVRVNVVNWEFDEHYEIRVLPGTDKSLDQWVVVNPVEFTIPAGQSQAVRFSIRPAVELAPGEHRTMLIFDEVPQPQAIGEATAPGAQTALRARFQFRTAIYCQVGQVTRSADLTQASANAKSVHLQLRATGNANTRFDGQYMVWKAGAFPGIEKVALLGNLSEIKPVLPAGMVSAGRLPGQPVLPGGTRNYDVPFDATLGAGSYVLVLLGNLGNDKLARQVPFNVSGH
jgi:P pilus assembly chaperone PapD